ncbi:MAG: prepilin-type N-terminal cleavage/methylation domain-containing protein [bacterium]
MKGFTLIELVLSLALFSYIFVGLMTLLLQFSKGYSQPTSVCASNIILELQIVLTNNDSFQIASTTDEVVFSPSNEVLKIETDSLYLLNTSDRDAFNATSSKDEYKIGNCGSDQMRFSKNTSLFQNTTNTILSHYIDPLRCLDIVSKNNTQTICALK